MTSKHFNLRSASALLGVLTSGCAFEFSEVPARPHGSVGAEVFRVVCMKLAAQAFPNDLTGSGFSVACDGGDDIHTAELTAMGEDEQRAYARYRALIARRERLVEALETSFDEEAYRPDEMRDFLANMVPLYDPPEQLPEVTRAVAALLSQLVDPTDTDGADAIAALERMSAREGYRPASFDLALTRAVLSYPKLDEVVRTTLSSVAPGGPARDPYEELLRAGAMDLVAAERGAPDPLHPGTLTVSKDLFFSENDAFSGTAGPRFMTRRDTRGLARPSMAADGALAAPFQDQDADGLADANTQGRFLLTDGTVATPYATFDPVDASTTSRDASGRAIDTTGQPIYASIDVDRTLLAGLLRESGPLLTPARDGHAPLLDYAYGMNALLGDYGPRTQAAGKTEFSFEGPDTSTGPLFDFVHAVSSTLPFQQTDDFFNVFQQLVRDHERELAGLIEAVLYIKGRSDAYPDAVFEKPHDFWDGMLAWALEVTNRPELLEGMLRALGHEDTAKAGPLMGNFMRYRDRVNHPFGSREELEVLGIYSSAIYGKLKLACTGPSCDKACDLTNRCAPGAACALNPDGSGKGTCKSISEAVQAHRKFVNYPCPNPPGGLIGDATDTEPGCLAHVEHPSPHHQGIRGCPADKPEEGASCAEAGGVGLCSWDAGSCTCDCEGGLCRHGAKPTWRCSETPTAGYANWVDRTQPDLRVAADGHSNQSLFQRTSALVHDLHVPAKWCSKEGANMIVYDPGGSNKPLLGNIVLFGPYKECGALNEESIVEIFARTIIGTAELNLQDQFASDLLGLVDDLNIEGINSNILFERQMQIRGMAVKPPKPSGVARAVFDPPVAFAQDLLDPVQTRDGNSVIDLHQDTILAWELEDPAGGVSYYTALKPFLTAMDSPDGKGNSNLDLFGDINSLAHKHWSSRATDSSVRTCEEGSNPLICDPQANLFAFQSNLVSYEELVAEALVDAQLMSRLRDLTLALTAIKLPNGKDGVSVLTDVIFNLLVPSRSCLDDDCENQPLRYRDGRASTTTNTGTPILEVSPLYLLLDALNAIDARFEGPLEPRLRPWREARSHIVDVFFDIDRSAKEQWRFKSPRGREILFESVGFLRRRLAQYRQEQDACLAMNTPSETCHQVHDWAFSLAPRLATSLEQPVSAATLRLLDCLREVENDPAGKLANLAAYLTTERAQDDAFPAMLLGTADLLQTLEDTKNLGPLMAFSARALAPNASDVAKGEAATFEVATGTLEKALSLVRSLQDIAPEEGDRKSTLASLLARLAKPSEKNGETPLDVILETIVAVNRATPSERGGGPLSSDDLRSMLRESELFLGSERHGLERLYDVVQSRTLP